MQAAASMAIPSRIEGATSWASPASSLRGRARNVIPKALTKQAAAKAAKELGYTNVKHYAPGISGWKQSGAPVAQSAATNVPLSVPMKYSGALQANPGAKH